MARISILAYTESFTTGSIDAVDYQVAKVTTDAVINDEYFNNLIKKEKETGHRYLILNIENDTKNVEYLDTPLPMLEEDIIEGVPPYYKDLDNIAIRVRVHSGESVSNWFYIKNKSQQQQIVPVTYNQEYKDPTDSYTLGWTQQEFNTKDPEVLQPKIIPTQEKENEDA